MSERQPTILDLFSGIAGMSLAFHSAGFRTLAFVEWDSTKQIILRAHFPDIPIHGDIDTFDCGEFLRTHGRPDVIVGGVPCGPTSLLGKRLGTADDRWKWPQTIRVVGELRPRFFVAENPPGLLTLESGRAFNGVVGAMAALGYDCRWDVIPAAAFGAGHWRERLCIVFADYSSLGREERAGLCESESTRERRGRLGDVSGKAPARPLSLDTVRGGRSEGREGRLAGDNEGQAEQTLQLDDADAHDARPQGHAGDGLRNSGRAGPHGPTPAGGLLPDLRNRVTGPDWWHEVVTGIPVLVPGLPGRLVEAASLCIGDSVVPQAWRPIAQALADQIRQSEGCKKNLAPS